MVDTTELRKINFMRDMPQEVLEKISTVACLEAFGEESILLRQGDRQERIFMLVSGKIYLNCRASTGLALTLDEVNPGQSFGVSSLLDSFPSTYSAICVTDSTVITLDSQHCLDLIRSNYDIGYQVMKQVVKKFKNRMNRHTQVFMKALAVHPAIRQPEKTGH